MKEINQIIFITLDCCRYDTTVMANIPFIRSLGPIRKAQSYGTYTLPSHISSFTGYLPNVTSAPLLPLYSRTNKQLWRLESARKKAPKLVEIPLKGNSIFEGYKQQGFYCLGTGGVRWFRNRLLTEHFDDFLYWGCDDYHDVFMPRKPEDFSLLHISEIVEKLSVHEKWFLFINSQETHVPYDTGGGVSEEILHILKRASPLWGGKIKNEAEKYVTNSEFKMLHQMQVKALEEVDRRAEKLINAIPGKKLIVICGDHGEAFGEEGMYGHGFPHSVIFDVPLLISVYEK